jgi:hypothetical protein
MNKTKDHRFVPHPGLKSSEESNSQPCLTLECKAVPSLAHYNWAKLELLTKGKDTSLFFLSIGDEVTNQPLPICLIFVVKVRSGITRDMFRRARDKHSSLFVRSIIDEEKKGLQHRQQLFSVIP